MATQMSNASANLLVLKGSICTAYCGEKIYKGCVKCPLSEITLENANRFTFNDIMRMRKGSKYKLKQDAVIKPAESQEQITHCRDCCWFDPDRMIACQNDYGMTICTENDFCSQAQRKEAWKGED